MQHAEGMRIVYGVAAAAAVTFLRLAYGLRGSLIAGTIRSIVCFIRYMTLNKETRCLATVKPKPPRFLIHGRNISGIVTGAPCVCADLFHLCGLLSLSLSLSLCIDVLFLADFAMFNHLDASLIARRCGRQGANLYLWLVAGARSELRDGRADDTLIALLREIVRCFAGLRSCYLFVV